tara:strand:- start:330 stop:1031 length:702 start_codon:yes stop_codon:yes gene_type:complete
MRKKGINLHFNANIDSIEKLPSGELLVALEGGERLVTDTVFYATGRRAMTNDLGLENVEVILRENGSIVVNDYYQTNEPSIYAIGDVKGGIELTPVALAEGMALVKTLFNGIPSKVDYSYIATAVFSQPNLATVGLSEEAAREQYENIDVYRSSFKHLKHTLSGNMEQTFMKLVVDNTSDKVVGVHMIGADAGEIIQGLAVALKAGATKAVFDQTIGIHPTAAEEFVTMRTSS